MLTHAQHHPNDRLPRATTLMLLAVWLISPGLPLRAETTDTSSSPYPTKPAVTQHTLTAGDTTLTYRATAATLPMTDETGKPKAHIFYVAYEAIAPETAASETTSDATTARAPTTTCAPTTTEAADPTPCTSQTAEACPTGKPAASETSAKPCDTECDAPEPTGIDPATRPITFVFNGGPGAAAVWLHLGTAGPKRVQLQPDGNTLPPPSRLVDNPQTWLHDTDLVFVDPVGTGFSRPAEGEDGAQFYGVKEDIRWVADFIRLYTTKYQRWSSPKFLAGESYGTTRVTGLSDYLLERYGIALNGIVLISMVLDFQTLQPGDTNDLPYPLFLPTYTAAAWYHQQLPAELQENPLPEVLQRAEQWALNSYLPALIRGDTLPDDDRDRILAELAELTGLDPDILTRHNLRPSSTVFRHRLLEAQRKILGRFDARITGFDADPARHRLKHDPSYDRYLALYASTFNDYVRRTLKFKTNLTYEVISSKVWPWKFSERTDMGYLAVQDNLKSAIVRNPSLKVLVASGYFDLATPYFATIYTLDHLNLPEPLRANVTRTFYAGGHMMYHNHTSLEKLNRDVRNFITDAVPDER